MDASKDENLRVDQRGNFGAHGGDPMQTLAEGCGGADVGPTEPGEGSGALLRLLAASGCPLRQRTLPPGQRCGHILRQRPRHRQRWVFGSAWLTDTCQWATRLPFSLRCREQANRDFPWPPAPRVAGYVEVGFGPNMAWASSYSS